MPLYSYSRIGCFENCPRQYKFRYIEKPDIDKPEGVEAFMGKMVHETLEKCYRLAQRGKTISREELLVLYRRRWEESLPENLRIVRDEMTAEDYFNLGVKSLEMYYDRYAPFDQEMTLGLERRIVFALDPEGKYKIQGFIDRLSRDSGGRLRIQDYKTSATLPTQQDIDADNQLALYQIGVGEMWPDNNGIELVWHFTQFDTTFLSHRDESQLEGLSQLYIEKIRKIERAGELNNFPIKESALCDWCDYNQICPAKGGAGASAGEAQQTITSMNESEVTSAVDEYIACDQEKKRLEKRLKEIREAFKQACGAESEKSFEGSDGRRIMMTLSTLAKLPTKAADKDAVERMKKFVQDEGLWEKFSSLDVANLQKEYTNGTLPESLMKELKRFEIIVMQDRLRIKKK
jgi:putative RecB family exonuclease